MHISVARFFGYKPPALGGSGTTPVNPAADDPGAILDDLLSGAHDG